MGTEMKIDPQKLKEDIKQISNTLETLNGNISNLNLDIKVNTCTSILNFDTAIDEVGAKFSEYLNKFRKNLANVSKSAGVIEEMDTLLASVSKTPSLEETNSVESRIEKARGF